MYGKAVWGGRENEINWRKKDEIKRKGMKEQGKGQGRKLRKGGTAQERVRQEREEKWEKRESKKECSHAIFESKIKNIKAQPNIPS